MKIGALSNHTIMRVTAVFNGFNAMVLIAEIKEICFL